MFYKTGDPPEPLRSTTGFVNSSLRIYVIFEYTRGVIKSILRERSDIILRFNILIMTNCTFRLSNLARCHTPIVGPNLYMHG